MGDPITVQCDIVGSNCAVHTRPERECLLQRIEDCHKIMSGLNKAAMAIENGAVEKIASLRAKLESLERLIGELMAAVGPYSTVPLTVKAIHSLHAQLEAHKRVVEAAKLWREHGSAYSVERLCKALSVLDERGEAGKP